MKPMMVCAMIRELVPMKASLTEQMMVPMTDALMVPMMDVLTAMMLVVRTVLLKDHMKVWHLVLYSDLGMAHMMAHS